MKLIEAGKAGFISTIDLREIVNEARAEHAFTQSRFTAKGVQWIAGLWAQHQLEVAA